MNRNTSWAKPTISAAIVMKAFSVWAEGGTKAVSTDVVVAARHAEQSEVVHREEDRVGADEGDPEVQLAHAVVEHAAGDLRVPVIDAAENDQDRRYAHHHVEVGDDEHGVGQRNVDDDVAEEQAGQAAIQKVTMKPMANSIGVVRWMSPRHRVRIQL